MRPKERWGRRLFPHSIHAARPGHLDSTYCMGEAVNSTHYNTVSLDMVGECTMPEGGRHSEERILLSSEQYRLSTLTGEISHQVIRIQRIK